MGLYDETVKVGRRTMVLFFIIDTSGSMRGAKIGQVNAAIEGILPKIKEISKENADAEIKVCVLNFAIKAKWCCRWLPIISSDGTKMQGL